MESYKLKNTKFLKAYIKMEKAIIKFGDIEFQEQKIHRHKGPMSIDIKKIVVSNKVSFSN